MTDPFQYKSPNFQKLKSYGFAEKDGVYSYATQILDGQFELRIAISAKGEIRTELIDLATEEPYTLHLVEEAGGTFVGEVRDGYGSVLADIAEQCFERDVFKSEQAHAVIAYIRQKYGDELEYLWKKFPSNAICRRKDNQKWYGILLILARRKLGIDSDEVIDAIDLRIDPEESKKVVDGKRYFPGYHMNIKTWCTMCLDGSVPTEEIFAWIDKSYELAKKG